MERKKHFFSILRAGVLTLTACSLMFASCGLKDDVDDLKKKTEDLQGQITDLKSVTEQIKATIAAGKLVASTTGDGTATDIVITFTDGTKLTIPKNPTIPAPATPATITVAKEETATYVKVTITTTNNGTSTSESFTINKPIGTISSIQMAKVLPLTPTAFVSGAYVAGTYNTLEGIEIAVADVRVNPSNALFVKENVILASSVTNYASAVKASDYAVTKIESIATGVYRVFAKAAKDKTLALSTATVVYQTPVEGGDPIQVAATTTMLPTPALSLKALAKVEIATKVGQSLIASTPANYYASWASGDAYNAATKDALGANTKDSYTSTSILNDGDPATSGKYPVSGIASAAYSIKEYDGSDWVATTKATVAASTLDPTKFVVTFDNSKFTKEDVQGRKFQVYVILTDVYGTKFTTSDGKPVVCSSVTGGAAGYTDCLVAFPPFSADKPITTLTAEADMYIPDNAAGDFTGTVAYTDAQTWDQLGIFAEYFKAFAQTARPSSGTLTSQEATDYFTAYGSTGVNKFKDITGSEISDAITFSSLTNAGYSYTVAKGIKLFGQFTMTVTVKDQRPVCDGKVVKIEIPIKVNAPVLAVKLDAATSAGIATNGAHILYSEVATIKTFDAAAFQALVAAPAAVNAGAPPAYLYPAVTPADAKYGVGVAKPLILSSTYNFYAVPTLPQAATTIAYGTVAYPIVAAQILTSGAKVPVQIKSSADAVLFADGKFPIKYVANTIDKTKSTMTAVKVKYNTIGTAATDITTGMKIVSIKGETMTLVAGQITAGAIGVDYASAAGKFAYSVLAEAAPLIKINASTGEITKNAPDNTEIQTAVSTKIIAKIKDVWGTEFTFEIPVNIVPES